MRRPLVFGLIGAVLGCSTGNAMQAACEEALKDRLLAPSTFKLIRATVAPRKDIPLSVYYAKEPNALKAAEGAGAKASQFEIILEYDSANAYGVPIRSYASCTYQTTRADPNDAIAAIVKINGQTLAEWTLDRILKGGARR